MFDPFLLFSTLCHSSVAITLLVKRECGCFTLILFKIPYYVYYKDLSNVYIVLEVVTYITYCHTNNKMIVYTRNDVEYSLYLLNCRIMLIYGV